MCKIRKSITLIELMAVIIIFGILTALAIPNVKNIRSKASLSQIGEDKVNIQKAVDRFALEKGKFPTDDGSVPTLAVPKQIDFTKLEPPYLIKKPQNLDKVYYWVDYFGTVWASDIDSPTTVDATRVGATNDFTVSWASVSGAERYNIGYAVLEPTAQRNSSDINADTSRYVWLQKDITGTSAVINSPSVDLSTAKVVVNAVSKNGLETVPVDKGYAGSMLLGNHKPTAVITMTPNQALLTTTTISWDHSTSTDPDGDAIVGYEWTGKQNIYSTSGNYTVKLRVRDEKGAWSDWSETTFYVIDASSIKKVVAGANHTLALTYDGKVKSWGTNSNGQLGVTGISESKVPVEVTSLSNVGDIVAGYYHNFAILNDGTVKAWGYNYSGQLGDGTTVGKTTPVTISISGVKQISAGEHHTLAVLNDGSVMSWGSETNGEIGDGDGLNTQKTTPYKIPSLSGATQVAAGLYHSVALLSDGTVKAWGSTSFGQVGNGSVGSEVRTPVSVLSNAVQISASTYNSAAVLNDGTVKVWGWNDYGQLGDGTQVSKYTPITVAGLSGVKEIRNGYLHTVALLNDGTVKAWGNNQYGQLGDGTITTRLTPVTVANNVAKITTYYNHTGIVLSDGSVKVAGVNNLGQLGIGSTTNSNVFVNIP